MATSDKEGRILLPTTMWDADSPHDTLMARVALNNALHFADMDAQVRACGTGFVLNTGQLDNTSIWNLITVAGPFPMRMHANGNTLYPMRCRMAGSSGGQAAAVKLRACVSAPGTRMSEMLAASTNVLEVATSSTTSAWLTATTGASGTTLLSFNNSMINDAFIPVLSTLDDIAGNPVTVETVQMTCSVWGQSTTTGTMPTLTGLYLAEYIGL